MLPTLKPCRALVLGYSKNQQDVDLEFLDLELSLPALNIDGDACESEVPSYSNPHSSFV